MYLSLLLALMACSESPPPPAPPPAPPSAPVAPKAKQDTGGDAPLNKPPQIASIEFQPASPTTLDAVRMEVKATDADGDRIDVDYQWFVNGQERFEFRDQVLPARAHKKGDIISVRVTANDGAAEAERTSSDLTIGNSIPRFLTDPTTLRDIDGFRVEAKDEDPTDKLTYSLQGAPKGMTIDPDIGVLRYEGTQDEPGGAYKITIIAEDQDGGQAGWTFGIQLSPGSAAAKSKTPKK